MSIVSITIPEAVEAIALLANAIQQANAAGRNAISAEDLFAASQATKTAINALKAVHASMEG